MLLANSRHPSTFNSSKKALVVRHHEKTVSATFGAITILTFAGIVPASLRSSAPFWLSIADWAVDRYAPEKASVNRPGGAIVQVPARPRSSVGPSVPLFRAIHWR